MQPAVELRRQVHRWAAATGVDLLAVARERRQAAARSNLKWASQSCTALPGSAAQSAQQNRQLKRRKAGKGRKSSAATFLWCCCFTEPDVLP